MRPVYLAAALIVAVVAMRATAMEAATKTVLLNSCSGPVAVQVDDPSCCGQPVALPVSAGCTGRVSLLGGVARRMDARQEGRQAKRATKQAVRSSLRSCAVPVALPTYAAVPVTSYVPVTTMQPVTSYKAVTTYQAMPLAAPTPMKAPCREPTPQPNVAPPEPQPNGDPPLSVIPSDHHGLTSHNYRT